MSTGKDTLQCDRCGRRIESGKGYISIQGWIICGICQYDSNRGFEDRICPYCGKYKTMQGNGLMHQLCECGT